MPIPSEVKEQELAVEANMDVRGWHCALQETMENGNGTQRVALRKVFGDK